LNPFQTHCYAENVVAPGIEPGTCGLAVRNSDHWTTEAVLATDITDYNINASFFPGTFYLNQVPIVKTGHSLIDRGSLVRIVARMTNDISNPKGM
jgi:hypothetical protein